MSDFLQIVIPFALGAAVYLFGYKQGQRSRRRDVMESYEQGLKHGATDAARIYRGQP